MDFLKDIQPYISTISAAMSLATLGFVINLTKIMRDNAQDRIAIQEERLKSEVDDRLRVEKWSEKEKQALKDDLAKTRNELDSLLKSQGIDLYGLALGKQISDSVGSVRKAVSSLTNKLDEMQKKLPDREAHEEANKRLGLDLSIAMGAMASGSFALAANHFDAYSKISSTGWKEHFARGVAHANARGGFDSDLSGLRAYNEAIALAPENLDENMKAHLFSYRGALLKRLGRLQEAEADLGIALTLAHDEMEVADIHYNFACVYAMLGKREKMLFLSGKYQVITLISALSQRIYLTILRILQWTRIYLRCFSRFLRKMDLGRADLIAFGLGADQSHVNRRPVTSTFALTSAQKPRTGRLSA